MDAKVSFNGGATTQSADADADTSSNKQQDDQDEELKNDDDNLLDDGDLQTTTHLNDDIIPDSQ